MTTPTSDDTSGKPEHPSDGDAPRQPSSGGVSRGSLHLVSNDPGEVARYAEAQRAAREQGFGAEPLSGYPVEYTASLPAFLNTDRVRDQVSRRVPDSAWQEYAPVDPSLTTAGNGYDYVSAKDDADERLLDEMDFSAEHAQRDERRAERRRRAEANAAQAAAKRVRQREQRRISTTVPEIEPETPDPPRSQEQPAAPETPQQPSSLDGSQSRRAVTRLQSQSPLQPPARPSRAEGLVEASGQGAAVSPGQGASPGRGEGPADPSGQAPSGAEPARRPTRPHLSSPRARVKVRKPKPNPLATLRRRLEQDPEGSWRVALVVVTAAASILLSIVMLYFPAQKLYLAVRENERLADELNSNYLRNDRMQRRVDYLQTEEGIQDEAHRVYGYVMPGENAVTVVGADVSDPYAPGAATGSIERGSGRNTHSVATDILDRVFGTGGEQGQVEPSTGSRVAIVEHPTETTSTASTEAAERPSMPLPAINPVVDAPTADAADGQVVVKLSGEPWAQGYYGDDLGDEPVGYDAVDPYADIVVD